MMIAGTRSVLACLAWSAAAGLAAPALAQVAASPASPAPVGVTPEAITAPPVAGPVSRAGPYLVAAIGRNDYDYGCWFFTVCNTARSTSGKLGWGYRFGTFAVEGWVTDFGEARSEPSGDRIRLRSLGVNASWILRFGEVAEGLLRAGIADVRLTREGNSGSNSGSKLQPTFGVGIGFLLSPTITAELAWDLARGDARDTSTVIANAASLGLRVRF